MPSSTSLQVYKPGKGLAFHFDKDEHAMKEKQQMIQPVLSSVLYLTGDSTQERLGIPILAPCIMIPICQERDCMNGSDWTLPTILQGHNSEYNSWDSMDNTFDYSFHRSM